MSDPTGHLENEQEERAVGAQTGDRPAHRNGRNRLTFQPRGQVMRFVNYLNRFRRYMRPQARRRRPEKRQSRPRVERLDDRVVPSTLQVDFGVGGKVFGHYTASAS